MKARKAHYGDVAQMVKVCRRLHEKSSWNALKFNPVHVKKNLVEMIRTDGMDPLIVVDDEGDIRGVLLATLDQFFMSKQWYATDAHFMCEAGGIQLLAEFKRWAKAHGAGLIIMGIANDDPGNRVHRFYEMAGLYPVGDAWVIDLKDSEEKAA